MKTMILVLLQIYKKSLSPLLETIFGKACRYEPTCSEYAYLAIEKYGIVKGGLRSIKRIARCHPFTDKFGYDPLT